ncbi:MAG: LysM peptidoglycan-binding domain-containing protein [Alphaproteobacteria bacterium]|nr:MAG: LysM peptidoglycan-binding domain-containing protein [Alphaproteobacteria bacterium]
MEGKGFMTMRRDAAPIAIISLLCLLFWANAQAASPIPHETLPAAGKPQPVRNVASMPLPSSSATTPAGADLELGEKALGSKDTDENTPLPEYPIGARISIGQLKTYVTGEEDTFADIARHFDIGYVELRAANPGVDPWSAPPGEKLVIPTFKLLPRAPQAGIVVNLGEMRMYYYPAPGRMPLTFPLGIGREGLETPTGQTSIVKKVVGPVWFPTDRMRKDKPWLPASIPPGAANPLGTHAMYLGWPTFLIHGSNKPWGIGRRVSSGCMRMYPEDIITMFNTTPVGMRVTVVNQPIKIGWLDDGLYLEANPSLTQSDQIEIDGTHATKGITPGMRENIINASGRWAPRIDWPLAEKIVRERRGIPVRIASPDAEAETPAPKTSYN